MNAQAIIDALRQNLPAIDTVVASDNFFFFYDPGGGEVTDRMFPFATLMVNDDNDRHSDLKARSACRLNVGVSREVFESLFGSPRNGPELSGYDFTAMDQMMPHPVYAAQRWICVVNPSERTFERLVALLRESFDRSAKQYRGKPR